MSWGTFWMYYRCPACGSKFSWDLQTMTNPDFGHCPVCDTEGILEGESSHLPDHPEDYPDCSE